MSQANKSASVSISLGSLLWIALIVWLLIPSPRSQERKIEALRSEVGELRGEIAGLRSDLVERGVVLEATASKGSRVESGSESLSLPEQPVSPGEETHGADAATRGEPEREAEREIAVERE